MLFDFFKDRKKIVDVRVDGEKGYVEKRTKWFVVAIVIAIGILTFGDFGGEKTEKENVAKTDVSKEEQKYMEETEKRIEEILSTVKGAGTVNVMIVFEERTEKVLATNRSVGKESEKAEGADLVKTTDETTVLMFGSGSAEQPFVTKEKLPAPKGVLVTATGAVNENVRLELYEAVKALCGISGHRIKIAPAEK